MRISKLSLFFYFDKDLNEMRKCWLRTHENEVIIIYKYLSHDSVVLVDTNLFFTGMSFRLGKLMSAIKGGQK